MQLLRTFFPVALSRATTVLTLLSILLLVAVGVIDSFVGVEIFLESLTGSATSILSLSDFVIIISLAEFGWNFGKLCYM